MSTSLSALRPPLLLAIAVAFLPGIVPASGQTIPAPTPADVPAIHPNADGISPESYRLAWHDEFDGPTIDTSRWDYRQDSNWGSTQLPGNVEIKDGKMRIALKKEAAGSKSHTGGGLISKQSFIYGYYEARFKVPATLGWHTSFWMSDYDPSNPNKVGGIGKHEMDVCEHDSFKQDSYTAALWMRKPKAEKAPKIPGYKRLPTPNLSTDFHTWGCEFTPDRVRYFFDGKEVRSFDISAYQSGPQKIWLTSIAANIGNRTGNPVDSELPAYAEFEYVRFFEKKLPSWVVGDPFHEFVTSRPATPFHLIGRLADACRFSG